MGRPRSDKQMTALSIRLSQEERDRLEAAFFHDGGGTRPSEVNLSQGVRQVLNDWLESFEDAAGGAEALSVAFNTAQIQEKREAFEQAQKKVPAMGDRR